MSASPRANRREGRGPDVHLNLNVRGMRLSATVGINERSNELLAAAHRVFKLGLGQSPFPVPGPVVEALRENAARKDYLPVRGLAARLAYVDFDGAAALDAVAALPPDAALPESFLRRHCGCVTEAIDRLREWLAG